VEIERNALSPSQESPIHAKTFMMKQTPSTGNTKLKNLLSNTTQGTTGFQVPLHVLHEAFPFSSLQIKLL
jgi:hypothetical protein